MAELTESGKCLRPAALSDRIVRSGPTFSNTGGVWKVTGSSLPGERRGPFLRQHVKQNGAFLIFEALQPIAERPQIVTVDRPDVAKTQLLEEHAAVKKALSPSLTWCIA